MKELRKWDGAKSPRGPPPVEGLTSSSSSAVTISTLIKLSGEGGVIDSQNGWITLYFTFVEGSEGVARAAKATLRSPSTPTSPTSARIASTSTKLDGLPKEGKSVLPVAAESPVKEKNTHAISGTTERGPTNSFSEGHLLAGKKQTIEAPIFDAASSSAALFDAQHHTFDPADGMTPFFDMQQSNQGFPSFFGGASSPYSSKFSPATFSRSAFSSNSKLPFTSSFSSALLGGGGGDGMGVNSNLGLGFGGSSKWGESTGMLADVNSRGVPETIEKPSSFLSGQEVGGEGGDSKPAFSFSEHGGGDDGIGLHHSSAGIGDFPSSDIFASTSSSFPFGGVGDGDGDSRSHFGSRLFGHISSLNAMP
mmetsp:Transcript_1661/g.3425  ORF Transcript_1661/g.3425 Transcript_1661/m.3425 type:complete len:364 (-) Transcript_1661:285-1376(-)